MKQQPFNSEGCNWLDVAKDKHLDVRKFLFSLFSVLCLLGQTTVTTVRLMDSWQRLRGGNHKDPTTFPQISVLVVHVVLPQQLNVPSF